MRRPRVALVGAGLAGLTAAYRLQQQGVSVELYEARQRVGGRVFSAVQNGRMAELGGQNILDGGEAPHLHALIKEFNLEISRGDSQRHVYWAENDELIDMEERLEAWRKTVPDLAQKVRELSRSCPNIESLMRKLLVNAPFLQKPLTCMISCFEGDRPINLSSMVSDTLLHMLCGGIASPHPDGRIIYSCLKEGNARLAECMAAALGENLHLGKVLTRVSKRSDGAYSLRFGDGVEAHSDRLVLAIPCSIYRTIDVDPEVISVERWSKLTGFPMGRNAKIIVPVEEGEVDTSFQCCNGRMVSYFPGNHTQLTLYHSGTSARFDAQSLEKTFQEERGLLERVYGVSLSEQGPQVVEDKMRGSYEGPIAHSWPEDPFARGSYSYIPAGLEAWYTSTESYGQETVKTVFSPIEDRLFFAGEHCVCRYDITGTMEAAVDSGEATARMLLRFY